ncbi:MAG: hypothetical protein COZ46_05025 [Verrucomicrobia bacterium CG_4_10_14_3_um_filter_43_23]|nr:MAG: hypothetical protein AUJ82_05345 [Verrucomicrobia bacterium CG1_02_43_26]PIP58751.1 MAG: hypothetical protein COX01_06985 [Verrucomicrobia bacterium CG22_combo_CG10-13_8_21_14_all_43_17]PIX58203.1 MAG: hypothetical protein COZ46_05025 [Verrucomicrobia bacterium CG_4_10_14_3_um_filter_43_23]PIY61538.1 MAG: hypothetical protein COY94_05020 [Verrucomicrobia bacterium CG_4_10_14_0_8_um_filter_43_34]PJA44394.1 MAG: hypothetical protein CO175_03020 [Verrucomicrobia bacterium CG_4_9_14_3_um_fi
MSTTNNNHYIKHGFAAVIGILVILAVFFGLLIWYVPNRPRPIDEKLIQDRYKALSQHQAEDGKKLVHYGWVDQQKQIVHLPIKRAMELTVNELHQQ